MTNYLFKNSEFKKRRELLLKKIKGSIAIFTSNPPAVKNRDTEHDYHQNSDLFYLTGVEEHGSALILDYTREKPETVLFLLPNDPTKEVWTGKRIGLKNSDLRNQFTQIECIDEFNKNILIRSKDSEILYFTPGIDDKLDQFIFSNFSSKSGPKSNFANSLVDARLITAELRLIKDRLEIDNIKRACEISAISFENLFRYLSYFKSEIEIQKFLELEFSKNLGEGLSFNTIVASGENSTFLHFTPTARVFKEKDLILIDAGCKYNGYCSDITRTVPISGKFSPAQLDVYTVVNQALNDSAKLAKKGNTLEDIHQKCVETLTYGLKELKILKGPVNNLINKGEYKRFFMHRTGHFLGIDVHDITPRLPSIMYKNKESDRTRATALKFKENMVFTIEPGLYFSKNDTTIPKEFRGIGIRIEDDFLITKNGHINLTSDLTRDPNELTKLIG